MESVTFKTFAVIYLLTMIWFTSFSGSSEIICSGDLAGKAFGNFVLWNMSDPVTSLSKIVDLKMFIVDLLLSYALTALIYFLILIAFKIKKPILQKRKSFVILLILSILIGSFFSLEFMFDMDFQTINCNRAANTFTFELRL